MTSREKIIKKQKYDRRKKNRRSAREIQIFG